MHKGSVGTPLMHSHDIQSHTHTTLCRSVESPNSRANEGEVIQKPKWLTCNTHKDHHHQEGNEQIHSMYVHTYDFPLSVLLPNWDWCHEGAHSHIQRLVSWRYTQPHTHYLVQLCKKGPDSWAVIQQPVLPKCFPTCTRITTIRKGMNRNVAQFPPLRTVP